MATAIVSIICIAMIVLGGMTMSQGLVTSADSTAFSIEGISVREGEMTRTEIDTLRAAHLSWGDLLRVRIDNSGQTKLSGFSKWDFIVHYYDSVGNYYAEWLPYTDGVLVDNEWQKAAIQLNGQPEFFEPGIMNPEEELVILSRLDPLPGDGTTGNVIITTPNGICSPISFNRLGYTLLTPHSENTTIASIEYFELAEATPADGTAITETTDIFQARELGRKIMHDENTPSTLAKHLFPLTGISNIPAATWTVYYRCMGLGLGDVQDNEVYFDINILIRKADGTLRTTLATEVANAYLENNEDNMWLTKSGTYDFTGYTVVNDTDYLEIVYYGAIQGNGSNSAGYLQLSIDDNTLAENEQTRIEA